MAAAPAPTPAPAEVVVPKKKKKFLIIIIALLAVILVGGGVGAYLLMSHPAAEKKAKSAHKGAAADDEEVISDDENPVYEKLDQFTVNLSDPESHILQTDVQLRLADAKVQEKLKVHMPEVRDALIRLLSSKTAAELATPEGKDKVGLDVQKSINEVLGVKKSSKGVKKVLFASFIIQ